MQRSKADLSSQATAKIAHLNSDPLIHTNTFWISEDFPLPSPQSLVLSMARAQD